MWLYVSFRRQGKGSTTGPLQIVIATMILLTALIHGAIIWLAARPQHHERW